MRFILSLLLAFQLLACSHIPIASMLKIAAMDGSQLVAIAPDELRVRVSLQEPYRLVADKMQLVLTLQYVKSEQQVFNFDLEKIETRHIEALSSWFKTSSAQSIYTFQLTETSSYEFLRFKSNDLTRSKVKSYQWRVNYWLDPLPQNNDKIGLDLEIKLAANQDYFYLAKNAQVAVEVNP